MHSQRVTGTVALLALLGAVLSGCTLLDQVNSHQQERVYATWAEVPKHASSRFHLPKFVPRDATDLRIGVNTNGPGRLLRFVSVSPVHSRQCVPSTLPGKPLLDTAWWPQRTLSQGMLCGGKWRVFVSGGAVFGWTD